MKLKAILFDLDGTLLPLEQKVFTERCFDLFSEKLAPYGYERSDLYSCMQAMIDNDGSVTNQKAMIQRFCELYGESALEHIVLFDDFYEHEFDELKKVCGFDKRASEIVKSLKTDGFIVAIATNPLFPKLATRMRIEWAGLDLTDFELASTYEDFHYCKPNIEFYSEFLNRLNLKPEECLMVGNDAVEDMVAEEIGMHVFLLTDCLHNAENVDISKFPRGDFDALKNYIETNFEISKEINDN